jgi:hypothetical protein
VIHRRPRYHEPYRRNRLGCLDARARRYRLPASVPALATAGVENVAYHVIPVPRWLSVEDAWDEIATFGQLVAYDPACRWAVVVVDADTLDLLHVA